MSLILSDPASTSTSGKEISTLAHATESAVPGTEVLNGSLVRNTGFFALQFAGGGVSVPAFQPKLRELYE